MTGPLSGGDARTQLAEALDEVVETVGLRELVQYASQEGSYCCTVGCGSGACESCPCCGAGWCVSGADGLPDGDEDRARWLEIAAEYNPAVAALAAMHPADETLRAKVETLAAKWEAEAKRHDDAEPVTTQDLTRTILAAKHCRAHARDLRAALAPLAAPDTGDETTPSPTNEKASTPR